MTGNAIYLLAIFIVIFVILVITCILLALVFEGRKNLKASMEMLASQKEERKNRYEEIKKEVKDIQTMIYINGNVDKLSVEPSDHTIINIKPSSSNKIKTKRSE